LEAILKKMNLAFVAFAFLVTALSSAPVQAQGSLKSQSLLERDMMASKRIGTFSSTRRLYHYFWMGNTSTQVDGLYNEPVHEWFKVDNNRKQRLIDTAAGTGRAGDFWNMDDHSTWKRNAGPGMYMAVDPNVTNEYGDTIFVMDVPKNTKYLGLGIVPLKQDTIAALLEEGYISKSQLPVGENTLSLSQGLGAEAFKNAALAENDQFRILLQNVMENLNIQFIAYGYKGHLLGVCKKSSIYAFVYTGTRPSNYEKGNVRAEVFPEGYKFTFMTNQTAGQFSPEENEINRQTTIFRNVLREVRTNPKDKITPALVSSVFARQGVSVADVQAIRDVTYNCQAP
jgi:hypothetical protein